MNRTTVIANLLKVNCNHVVCPCPTVSQNHLQDSFRNILLDEHGTFQYFDLKAHGFSETFQCSADVSFFDLCQNGLFQQLENAFVEHRSDLIPLHFFCWVTNGLVTKKEVLFPFMKQRQYCLVFLFHDWKGDLIVGVFNLKYIHLEFDGTIRVKKLCIHSISESCQKKFNLNPLLERLRLFVSTQQLKYYATAQEQLNMQTKEIDNLKKENCKLKERLDQLESWVMIMRHSIQLC